MSKGRRGRWQAVAGRKSREAGRGCGSAGVQECRAAGALAGKAGGARTQGVHIRGLGARVVCSLLSPRAPRLASPARGGSRGAMGGTAGGHQRRGCWAEVL